MNEANLNGFSSLLRTRAQQLKAAIEQLRDSEIALTEALRRVGDAVDGDTPEDDQLTQAGVHAAKGLQLLRLNAPAAAIERLAKVTSRKG